MVPRSQGCGHIEDKGGSGVPIWVLLMGGAGIVVGLSTWGYKVMQTIGSDLVEINFAKGATECHVSRARAAGSTQD